MERALKFVPVQSAGGMIGDAGDDGLHLPGKLAGAGRTAAGEKIPLPQKGQGAAEFAALFGPGQGAAARAELKGVQTVDYDETSAHYNNVSALYSITFDCPEEDEECLTALDTVKEHLSGYDLYVSTSLGDTEAEIIAQEVNVIMVYVAIIVVAVLIFTSQTYAEIPVLLLTFVISMVLNSGTNFLFGTISFVSNSVTSILQLALSLDYAIIFSNHFREEHETLPLKESVIEALSKSIPEISSSCLTTVGGLVAMMFMQFKIGPDMAVCLIKAIAYSILSVFLVMPGLLMIFGPWMEKTEHKSFVPKIPFVGRFAYKTRKIIPPVFLVVVVIAYHFSSLCPYAYGLDSIKGLSNIEAMDGYCLEDKLTARQFSEMVGLDYELAQTIYAAYAAENDQYNQLIGSFSTYSVPLMDMFLYVCDKVDSGLVTLDDDLTDTLHNAQEQMLSGKAQLQGKNYNRILIYLSPDLESGQTTYDFTDEIQRIARKYYPEGNIYLAGDVTSEYDFQKSFAIDNKVVSIVSILIVLVVLLILVIQGSIWINFSFPTFTHSPLFYLSYLVVSSIQMGANIDYAIVIATRYSELKNQMPHEQAIIETMNFAFPTILTSGTILAASGILIGQMTSHAAIVGIGQSLGRGTIISMILVLFVLPQILLLGGVVVDKTSFSMPKVTARSSVKGRVRVNGIVKGQVNGEVSGTMNAIVNSDVQLTVLSGNVTQEEEDEPKQ